MTKSTESNIAKGEVIQEPPDLTVEMRPDWFDAAWTVSGDPDSDDPRIAVAALHIIRERVGMPVVGVTDRAFRAYQAGEVGLEDIRAKEGERVSFYSGHANSKNLGWEPVERTTYGTWGAVSHG